MNGGLEPVLLLLPKLPIWDMDTLSRPVHEASLLHVDFSSLRPRDQMSITPTPCGASTPPSFLHSAMECPSEAATHPSMATKLQNLLSWVVLDTSSPASGDSTPRRLISAAWGAPLTLRVEDLFRPDRPDSATPMPKATPQQASPQGAMPNDAVLISHSPSPTLALENPEVASIPTACNPRLILGQTWVPSLGKYSDCMGR